MLRRTSSIPSPSQVIDNAPYPYDLLMLLKKHRQQKDFQRQDMVSITGLAV